MSNECFIQRYLSVVADYHLLYPLHPFIRFFDPYSTAYFVI